MILDTLFLVFACLIILKGVVGVLEGRRYLHYVHRHLSHLPFPWMPFASVIVPCKGLEYQLEENVSSVLNQVYPFFEVVLVTATEDDPSRPLLDELRHKFPGHVVKLVTAGISDERGEKVNNLIEAVSRTDPRSEVLVFVDSDSRPHPNWLQALISPLQNDRIGVSTGYRWYFPERGNYAGIFRSAWNASVATLLGDHGRNFAWGGSMAIRRSTFVQAKVLRYWSQSISDDYSITQAMRDSNLRIHYEPRCLIGSAGKCSWRELIEWSTRQLIITRFYSRKLWRLTFLSQGAFLLVWWTAALIAIASLLQALKSNAVYNPQVYLNLLKYGCITCCIFVLGVTRGWFRLKAIQYIFPDQQQKIKPFWWGYTLLFPLVSTLTGYNLLVSAVTTRLQWRGIQYEFQPDGRLRVVRRDGIASRGYPAAAKTESPKKLGIL
jgi:ceramide glucosyltransferase